MFDGNKGMCQTCFVQSLTTPVEEMAAAKEAQLEKIAQSDANVESIILTTETFVSERILERLEIVTAEVAFGQNIFKDLFVDVRNIVGGRSATVQATMRDARRTVLRELKQEAALVGANAVIAVDLDYVELSSHSTMVMLVASGTAVRLETS